MLLKNPDFDKKYVCGWLKEFDQALDGDYLAIFERVAKIIKASV